MLGTSAITLLSNGELDTLALWKGNPWLLGTNDEDVGLAGSERVVYGILDVDDVEASIVTLTVGDDTNTTHVTAAGDHGDDTRVELDEVGDLASGEVNLDSVVDLDGWVWVTDAKWGGQQLLWVKGALSLVVSPKLRFQTVQEALPLDGKALKTGIDQSLDQRLNDV